jgi:HD-GYP domain-containing protein (c-di-GMP phosphodiesterase class II)
MRFLPISHLKGGEVLAVNIINANMQVLMRAGVVLSKKYIDRIIKYGIKSVYIKDPVMEPFIEYTAIDTIEAETRLHSVHTVKDSFQKFDKKVKQQKTSKKYGDIGLELFESLKPVAQDLINEIINAKNIKVAMMNIKKQSEYQFEHSVNVAVLSIMIGVEMGLPTKDLESLAYGALLIDIGYRWVDPDLLNNERSLSPEELEELQSHVQIGYEHIKDNTAFNGHVKSIILQHHERIDGSGYPNKLHGDEIHRLSKIVMIADVYDALTSDRSYRNAFRQNEGLEFIMAHAGTLFDFKVANIFARKVIPYPVGTYVMLSNKFYGVVLENNSSYPLRPKVKLIDIDNKESDNHQMIDLMEIKNVVISEVIYGLPGENDQE